jgi:hypothetical protein
MLLATALTFEVELAAADNWPPRDPLRWGLDDLLGVAEHAGWFDGVDFGAYTLAASARMVQWLRNLVHPGKFIREMPPGSSPPFDDEAAFQAVYAVLDAAFTATAALFDAMPETSDDVQAVLSPCRPQPRKTPISRGV